MIEPTVGRVVHLQLHLGQKQPMKADIAYVFPRGQFSHSWLINVGYLDHNGNHAALQTIELWDGTGDPPSLPYATWMPYQVGQAARTDNAESKLSGELALLKQRLEALESQTHVHPKLRMVESPTGEYKPDFGLSEEQRLGSTLNAEDVQQNQMLQQRATAMDSRISGGIGGRLETDFDKQFAGQMKPDELGKNPQGDSEVAQGGESG